MIDIITVRLSMPYHAYHETIDNATSSVNGRMSSDSEFKIDANMTNWGISSGSP